VGALYGTVGEIVAGQQQSFSHSLDRVSVAREQLDSSGRSRTETFSVKCRDAQ